jgi:hypothetical protein
MSFQWTNQVPEAPNQPPTVGTLESQSNLEGDTVTLTISANDPEGGAVNFVAENLPPGLSIDPTTGVVNGTIANGAADGTPYTVTINVSDAEGLTTSLAFNWLVQVPVVPEVTAEPTDNSEGGDGGSGG